MNKTKIILIAILTVSFLVRFAGINYGLPLWVVPDEPGSVFGALKMMELKTLIPANHIGEFLNVLYYPPFISYLYIIPFSILLGFKFLFANIPAADFKNLAIIDLSWFFIIARFFSVIIGTITVWLVYKISKIFLKRCFGAVICGLFVSCFAPCQFLPLDAALGLGDFFIDLDYLLPLKTRFFAKKKYLWASLVAGIGMGINYQVGLSTVFMLFWFFFTTSCRLEKL